METPDLPQPDLQQDENKRIRGEIDNLLDGYRKEDPSVKGVKVVRQVEGDSYDDTERIEVFDNASQVKALDEDLVGLDWTNEDYPKARVVEFAPGYERPNVVQNPNGEILYVQRSVYYIGERGNAIKYERYYHSTERDIERFKAKQLISNMIPPQTIPNIKLDNPSKPDGYVIGKLDHGDYERIGVALNQIKSGQLGEPTFYH